MLASTSRNAARTSSQASGRLTRIASSFQAYSAQQIRRASAQATTRLHEQSPIARASTGPFRTPAITSFRDPTNRTSMVARCNIQLNKMGGWRKTAEMFALCRKMKNAGVQPDHVTYDLLLQTCGEMAMHMEAWAVFEDMLAVGLHPDAQTIYHLMNAMRLKPISDTWNVWDTMYEHGIEPNRRLYECVIVRLANGQSLETALQYLAEMSDKGIAPSLKTVQSIIKLACHLHLPRLALQLAQAFDAASVRRIDSQSWMRILIASSEALYADGVLAAWEKTVKAEGTAPDEGCCVNVLHTAGRHGLSNLGLEALGAMRKMNIVWQEHHFAPVLEAFCNEGNIREALGLLELMRDSDIPPVMETAYPIFRLIRTDVDKVDEAFGILETIKEEGKKVDVIALNVVIQACVALGDLQRALGTYKAAGDLGVQPSVDTYNTLLSACVAASHRELGDRLITEMRDAKIKPNVRTYERLIVLCLTQPTYEDAFFYLEEMKGAGMLPTQSIYEALIKRCVAVGDTRYKLAVEEMLENGYEMPPVLQSFIENGGQEPEPKPRRRREHFHEAEGEVHPTVIL